MTDEHLGAEWLRQQHIEVSGFGERVADLLHYWQQGIYHVNRAVMRKSVDWSSERWIQIIIDGSLSTYDYDDLTKLVFLAHLLSIRVEIDGAAPCRLKLSFSPRNRNGRLYDRHPYLQEAVDDFLKRYGNAKS